jgi:cytochrome c-type biogenesis protein CcmH
MPDNLLFWLIAAAMTALALAFVLPRLAGKVPGPERPGGDALNAAISRDELAELDRARSEGRLTDGEYAEARLALERRLLAETGSESAVASARAPTRRIAAAVAVALPVLAFALYALIGEPLAVGDHSRMASGASNDVEDVPVQRDALARHLARHPADARGWVLLARGEFAADRFAEAAAAYEKAIAASPKVAADPGIWCEYADALGMAQGGALAGRPRESIQRALSLDAAHPKALEMAGSAAYEQRDYAGAAHHWKQLLAQLAPGSPEQRELAAAIARVERMHVATGTAMAGRP